MRTTVLALGIHTFLECVPHREALTSWTEMNQRTMSGKIYYHGFHIAGIPCNLVTNWTHPFPAHITWDEFDESPHPLRGIKMCLLVERGSLPLKIPERARQIGPAATSTHYLYDDLWLIDFGSSGAVMVDRDREILTVFALRHRVRKNLLSLEAFFYPQFELMRRYSVYPIHSGGVSLGGKGMVIAGRSRAGKSTLIVHLVRAGFGFLSDDRCLMRKKDGRCEVVGLQDTARLFPGNVRDLTELHKVSRHFKEEHYKKEYDMTDLYPDCATDSAPITSIILPQWNGNGVTRIKRIPPVEAAVQLLPLSVETVFSDTARTQFQFIGELVEQVPVYRVELGEDRWRWPHLMRELIGEV